MRKITFIVFSLLTPLIAASQVFWTEDFTLACSHRCLLPYTGVNGTWTWVSTGVNGAAANTWYVSYTEGGLGRGACGASSFDASLHIGNVSTSPAAFLFCPKGDCGAAYDASSGTDGTNARAQSPVIDCSLYSTITLSFNYIMNGQTGKDYATVWYYDGSTVWTLLASPPKSGTCGGGQGHWKNYSVALPASANGNANVQIGFNWTNNTDNAGNDPSFAVDSVQLNAAVFLPIQLIKFEGSYNTNDNNVYLDWSTATETNNHFFTIERAIGGGDEFVPVATVQGAGNSDNTRYYSTIDNSTADLSGTLYYRLKQTDYDGKYVYFNTVAVTIPDKKTNTIYPNPASANVSIDYYTPEPNSNASFSVYDYTGRKVITTQITSANAGKNTYQLDVSLLPKGMYIIEVNEETKTTHYKFVKN